jgi:hypothetical protein
MGHYYPGHGRLIVRLRSYPVRTFPAPSHTYAPGNPSRSGTTLLSTRPAPLEDGRTRRPRASKLGSAFLLLLHPLSNAPAHPSTPPAAMAHTVPTSSKRGPDGPLRPKSPRYRNKGKGPWRSSSFKSCTRFSIASTMIMERRARSRAIRTGRKPGRPTCMALRVTTGG